MRKTKKLTDSNYVTDTYILLKEPWKSLANKLGQLEDIEDEFKVDLIQVANKKCEIWFKRCSK